MSEMYRMICDKCGATVRTNQLSSRVIKCSCIGCDGNFRNFNCSDIQKLEARLEQLEAFVRSINSFCTWDGTDGEARSINGELDFYIVNAKGDLRATGTDCLDAVQKYFKLKGEGV